jgi:hypothetical protein
MAMLKKVNAVISTLLEISSVHEIPEAKKYLKITLVEMMPNWNAKKTDARMALIKWTLLKTSLTFIRLKSFPYGVWSRIKAYNAMASRKLQWHF